MQFKPAVTALVSAVALATLLSGCKKEEAAPAAQAPQVGVVTIQPQAFTLTSELPGRTSAYRVAEVRPQVNGIILKRLFKEGSEVKEGQQLYQIDPAVYEATLANAKANLLATRSLAERYKQLIDEQAVSKQEYDDANAKRLQAEASLKSAQIDLRYTKVLAPISGRIGRSSFTEGALVSNGQTDAMATIQQLDPIYVDVTQSTAELLKLRRDLESGQLQKAGDNAASVQLVLEDGSLFKQEGRLEFSEVAVDETTGSVTLRALFPNPDHTLLPGIYGAWISPMPIALTTACTLLAAPSLARMLLMWNVTVRSEMLSCSPISLAVRPSLVQLSTSRSRLVSEMLAAGDSFGTRNRPISECERLASQLACSVRLLISAGVRRSERRAMVNSPNTPRAAQLDCATPTDMPKSRASRQSDGCSAASASGQMIMFGLAAPSRTVGSISM